MDAFSRGFAKRPGVKALPTRPWRDDCHSLGRRHPRAGVSLVEMLIVITVAAVMVGLSVTTIHLLLRAEHEARSAARYAASVRRLAHHFRDDIHFSSSVELPAADLDQPAALIAQTGTSESEKVRYELNANRATRITGSGPDDLYREDFYFPPHSRLSFERNENEELVRLAIEMPRDANRARADSVRASEDSMRKLAIDASMNRLRRLEATNREGEVESE